MSRHNVKRPLRRGDGLAFAVLTGLILVIGIALALDAPTAAIWLDASPSPTLTVTILPTTAPTPASGPCDVSVAAGSVSGLITAINSANSSPTVNVICLAAGSTYTLTSGPYEAGGPNGLPLIASNMRIVGNGATITRGSAAAFRILFVNSPGMLTLEDVTISNGSATNGGGISNYGWLDIVNSRILNNTAGTYGGGIYSRGPLTIEGSSEISGNTALGLAYAKGGAIYVYSSDVVLDGPVVIGGSLPNQARMGGGIALYSSSFRYTSLIVRNGVQILNNTATTSGGGLYIDMETWVLISSATITGNQAGSDGGGIYGSGSHQSTLTLNDSWVNDNRATRQGGGLYLSAMASVTINRGTITGNQSGSSGGGMYVAAGPVTLSETILADNTGTEGGGIYSHDRASWTAHDNCITGNAVNGFYHSDSGWAADLTGNWWGSASGPSGIGPGWGDGLVGDVTYQPFLTDAPPGCAVLPTPTPTFTPSPSYTPTKTLTPTRTPSPSYTPTLMPTCDQLSIISLSLAGNKIQLYMRNNNPAPVFISQVYLPWQAHVLYPDMYVAEMRLYQQSPFWQGADYTPDTTVNSASPGWIGGDGTSRRFESDNVLEIVFQNGPPGLDWYYSGGNFDGAAISFSILWNGTSKDCTLTLHSGGTPTPTHYAPYQSPTPTATRTIDPAATLPPGCVPLGDAAGTILCTQ